MPSAVGGKSARKSESELVGDRRIVEAVAVFEHGSAGKCELGVLRLGLRHGDDEGC